MVKKAKMDRRITISFTSEQMNRMEELSISWEVPISLIVRQAINQFLKAEFDKSNE